MRGDEEQRAFAHEREEKESAPELQIAEVPPARHLIDQARVQRTTFLGANVEQEIAEEDAAGGERERRRHVEHRPLASLDARFAQDLQPVRDRLDPGVGAAAHAVGAQKRDRDREEPDLADLRAALVRRRRDDAGKRVRVAAERDQDHDRVRDQEADEDRHQHGDRLLHPAQIEQDEDEDRRDRGLELERLQPGR